MARWLPLLLLGLAFCVCASWYALTVPYRTSGEIVRRSGTQVLPDIGMPDERQHANYIRHWQQTRTLPEFKPQSPDFYETYQSHQAPLYYVLASTIGDPTGPTGRNTRFFNVLIGLITLLGLFWLGRWATDRDEVGWAVSTLALLPGFVMLHGSVTNDPLLFCFLTWLLAMLVRGHRVGWTLPHILIAGGLGAGALLTKSSALAIVPTLILVAILAFRAAPTPESKPAPRWAPLMLLILPIAAVLPWWMRNASLYGDALGLRAFEGAFGGTAQASDFIAQFGAFTYWTEWFGWWTLRSIVGVFGYMNIFLPDTLYRLTVAGLVVCLAGLAMHAREQIRLEKQTGLIIGSFFLVVALLHIRFNMTYFQAQARYLFPAFGAMAFGLGYGLVGLAKQRAPIVIAVVAIALFGMNAFALTQTIPSFFQAIRLSPNP